MSKMRIIFKNEGQEFYEETIEYDPDVVDFLMRDYEAKAKQVKVFLPQGDFTVEFQPLENQFDTDGDYDKQKDLEQMGN